MNETMKAVGIFEHGDTNTLKFDNYPMPLVGDHDTTLSKILKCG